MDELTPKQIKLLRIAKEKGFLKFNDFRKFYSTKQFISNAIQRLIELGYLTEVYDLGDTLKFTGKEFE